MFLHENPETFKNIIMKVSDYSDVITTMLKISKLDIW